MTEALLRHKENGFFSIPNKLKRHFIHGLFLGDGCIYSNGTHFFFSIINEFPLIKDIQKYLIQKLGLYKTKLQKWKCKSIHEQKYTMRYDGRNNIKKIYNFLYKNANIYMDRKHKIFLDIIS